MSFEECIVFLTLYIVGMERFVHLLQHTKLQQAGSLAAALDCRLHMTHVLYPCDVSPADCCATY